MPDAPIMRGTVDPLPDDAERTLHKLARHDDVVRIAVMPDVHLSHEVCVGIAVATRETLLPAAVGGDIGCGMAAVMRAQRELTRVVRTLPPVLVFKGG